MEKYKTTEHGNVLLNDEELKNHQKLIDLNNQEQLSKSYINNRLLEYPSLNSQLDLLYWDKVNGTNKWQELITSIKAKYPKPEVK